MEVVGAAADPLVAREMIKALNPDVLTLDVEMPKMDGLEFLERLMRLRPMPVVMVSSLTEQGSEITLRALELGAVDFVAKPKIDIAQRHSGLRQRDRATRSAPRVDGAARRPAAGGRPRATARAAGRARQPRCASTEKLIIIGASTGGTEAIKEVLMGMPPDAPGILITQHMPGGFTKSFADPARQPVPHQREGGRGRRAHPARPRLHRARAFAPAAQAQRRELRDAS